MSVQEVKRTLRKQIGARLRSMDPNVIFQESNLAATVLRRLEAYRKARTVAFYMHMDQGELRTDKMLENAFEDRKRVFLPKIVPLSKEHRQFEAQKSHLQMLEMPNIGAVRNLKPRGKYGIKEPTEGVDALSCGLDLIVLPGVAYTCQCDRLGHGAAYYDGFIEEHFEKLGAEPVLVGVGLTPQLLPSVPVEPHDKTLNAVIIGDHLYSGL